MVGRKGVTATISSTTTLSVSVVVAQILDGKLTNFMDTIEGWSKASESGGSPPACWDLRVGNALWARCADLKKSSKMTPEIQAIQKTYEVLVSAFCKESEFFLDRLKVLGICNKFLIGVHKLNLIDVSDRILKAILNRRKSSIVKLNYGEDLKSIFNNFYAVLWNHFRDHYEDLHHTEGLKIVKQSLSWLALQGLEHFQGISHKLYQVNYLLTKSCSCADIIEFVSGFVQDFITVSKEAIYYITPKGEKSKKPSSSEFFGLISISFIVARLLVHFEQFRMALEHSHAVVGLGAEFFDCSSDCMRIWKKAVSAYVKSSSFVIWMSWRSRVPEVKTSLCDPKSYFRVGQELREIRKTVCTSKFEKEFPGYNLAVIYSLIESIGGTTTFFASKFSLSTVNPPPLDAISNFIRETYSLSEAFNRLKSKSDKILTGVTVSKSWDNQVSFMFQVFKTICDRVGDKDLELDEDIHTVSELCYSSLMSLSNSMSVVEEKKISELHSRLSQYSCNLGFGYQRRKNFEVAFSWSNRAIDAYGLWEVSSCRVEFKINTLSMTLLVAECLRQLNKGEEGLRWLSKWLVSDPSRLNSLSVPYDIYEQIPWSDWNTHWVQLYKDMCTEEEGFSKTVIDFIEEEDPDILDDEFTAKALRFEMNSYFCGRQVIASGIVTVGEALLERTTCPSNNLLGYLARSIGYWWGSPDQVDFSVELLQEATLFIHEEQFFHEGENADTTTFLSALVMVWRGLAIMKSGQFFVEAEMDILKQQLMTENPDKYKDRDTGEERGVSGFSSLNYDYEKEWVTFLIQGTEILFRFSETEEVLKEFAERHCPAFIIVTCRLVALMLSAVGVSIHAVKAWSVLNKLAKIYEKKGLMVLSASEMLKVIPDLEMEAVKLADKANTFCVQNKLVKHNRAICHRLSLAKAIACFNNRTYVEGIDHLLEVFKFVEEKDNFDSTHHLLGETSYVLSLYRGVVFSHGVDLAAFPSTLSRMSPAGLATKGYKLLCGLTRELDVTNSGWTDLFHNYYLVGSIMHMGAYTMKLLKDCGKTRELKCFTSDAVQLAQHCGFISRSIALVVPMIETDIEARNFKQAQMKIDVINQVLKTSSCPADKEVEEPEKYQKLVDNMKLPSLSISRLESVSELKWNLKGIDTPSFYYRNRSEKVVSTLAKDLRGGFDTEEFFAPPWLRHHLSCTCYICIHPNILPVVFNFLHAQARYLSCISKYKHAMAVLETSKLYHERAIFRHIYNLSVITMPLSAISSKRGATMAIDCIYTPFCVQPGLHAILTQMVICPAADIKMIINAMKKAIQIIDTLDPKDYIAKSLPVEIGCAAIHQYFIATGRIKLREIDIRQTLIEKQKQQEKENKRSASPPSPTPKDSQLMRPPVVPKKGILKTTAKKVPARSADGASSKLKGTELQYSDYLDERALPHIPVPNFDVDFDDTSSESSPTCSSSSSTTSSASRGNVKPESRPPPAAAASSQRTLRSNVTERRRRL